MIALNCNKPIYVEDYERLGTLPGACHHCHTGACPVGVTTQDPRLEARLDLDEAAERVENFLNSMTMELQMMARACGKSNVHDLEPEDVRALTIEAALIIGVPLVGVETPLAVDALADAIAARLAAAETNGHRAGAAEISGAHQGPVRRGPRRPPPVSGSLRRPFPPAPIAVGPSDLGDLWTEERFATDT